MQRIPFAGARHPVTVSQLSTSTNLGRFLEMTRACNFSGDKTRLFLVHP